MQIINGKEYTVWSLGELKALAVGLGVKLEYHPRKATLTFPDGKVKVFGDGQLLVRREEILEALCNN